MQSIVCQVESQPDRVSFTWSQGKDSFEPYHLSGDLARDFAELAQELRAKLADVVASHLDVAHRPSSPARGRTTGGPAWRWPRRGTSSFAPPSTRAGR